MVPRLMMLSTTALPALSHRPLLRCASRTEAYVSSRPGDVPDQMTARLYWSLSQMNQALLSAQSLQLDYQYLTVLSL